METLVKFCLVGLTIGAWFSEYVLKRIYWKYEIATAYYHKYVSVPLQSVHPLLLFTLMVGLCILLIQERMDKNALFVKTNPQVFVTNWSIIP